MSDVIFETKATWEGDGKTGEGKITLGNEAVTYSNPGEMNGKGKGTNPEELLIGAVTTCYSGTLYTILTKKRLPVQHVSVRAEGIITGYPANMDFEQLIVHPTITGGNNEKIADYEKAALTAKDKCFIGQTIAGSIAYKVGKVEISE